MPEVAKGYVSHHVRDADTRLLVRPCKMRLAPERAQVETPLALVRAAERMHWLPMARQRYRVRTRALVQPGVDERMPEVQVTLVPEPRAIDDEAKVPKFAVVT